MKFYKNLHSIKVFSQGDHYKFHKYHELLIMSMQVLNVHTNVPNDNSAVEVSVYILLLANEALREKDAQTYLSVCVSVCRSMEMLVVRNGNVLVCVSVFAEVWKCL
jgi:hypothetical protein